MPGENKKSFSEKMNETKLELKKVQWPTKKQLMNYTILTIVTVIVMGLLFYLIDSGIGFIVTKLISL